MGKECWKQVVFRGAAVDGFDVSDLGNVRSWLGRGPKPRRMPVARHLSLQRHSGGYRYVQLPQRLLGAPCKAYVHRLVLETFVGPCPDGMEACHGNGDNSDNRLENLRWDLHQSNIDDKTRHGTQPAGEAHGMHRLTASDVRQIRAHRGWFSAEQLAGWYGVATSHIYTIWANRAWQDASAQTRPFLPMFYTPVALLDR